MRITKTLDNPKSRMGDPMVITWGIVPDGTPVVKTFASKESGLKSDFVATLDRAYDVKGEKKGNDYSKRPWFKAIEGAFRKFETKTGLTYVYVPYDDGEDLGYVSSAGKKKRRADVRIGGHALDGSKGLRAFSGYPGPSGYAPNIIFNTSHQVFGTDKSLNFLIGHENMHNLGIHHILVNSKPALTAVSSAGIGTGQGPQFDDLLGLHMRYGDPYEKNKGNDTIRFATDFGELEAGKKLALGLDADSLEVNAEQTDFVSIDGKSDVDVYQFTVRKAVSATIRVTPMGPAYEYLEEDRTRKSKKIDAAKLNDLDFVFSTRTGKKTNVNEAPLGQAETLTRELSPGRYYISVRGKEDAPQFYSIEVSTE